MILYALLSLFASAISITLGISVFLLDRTARLNKLFMVMMIFNSYWAFCLFMMSQSPSLVGAVFWQKVLFLWPFLLSVLMHFTLVYTESSWLRNKFIYVALYFPALFFALTDFTTNLITATPVLKFWGYQNSLPTNSLLCWFDNFWACSFAVLSIVLFARYYHGLVDKTKKQQAKFVWAAFTIPILVALVTDSFFPFSGIDFPGLGTISCSITTFFVAYSMLKYDLFSFRPEIVAEKIFSTMPDSVILINLEGKIIKVNQSLLTLLGYHQDEVVDKSIYEMLELGQVLNSQKEPPIILERLQVEREIKNYEISFFTKGGERKVGALSCSMVTGSRGKDVGAAFVLHDVTQRREMESKLLKAERYASIGELAGMLGHDLRNPLSGIRGATFYLRRKLHSKLDGEDLALFESIDKSIDYSNKIITDLLDYASYYSDEVKLQLTQVTAAGLVKAALTLTPKSQNVTIEDKTVDLPVFSVDEVKVVRSFINILKNGYDAMPGGGVMQVSSVVVEGKVVFAFKDNGVGMSQETIEKLWTPLFTTKAKGMGFGMVICKRNIEAHGGKIALESVLGQGTTITVEMPLNLSV